MSKRKLTYAIALALLTVFLTGAMVGSAGEASMTETGGGPQETDNEVWYCDKNNWVKVEATVDDGGKVWAEGDCGGAYADCHGNGFCSGSSEDTTSTASTGNCKGGGDGGWYTKVKVRCWDQNAGSTSSSSTSPFPGLSVGFGEEQEQGTVVTITGQVNDPKGMVCEGGSCEEFNPDCTWDRGSWECSTP